MGGEKTLSGWLVSRRTREEGSERQKWRNVRPTERYGVMEERELHFFLLEIKYPYRKAHNHKCTAECLATGCTHVPALIRTSRDINSSWQLPWNCPLKLPPPAMFLPRVTSVLTVHKIDSVLLAVCEPRTVSDFFHSTLGCHLFLYFLLFNIHLCEYPQLLCSTDDTFELFPESLAPQVKIWCLSSSSSSYSGVWWYGIAASTRV